MPVYNSSVIVWPVLDAGFPAAHTTIVFQGPILDVPDAFDTTIQAVREHGNLSAPGDVDVVNWGVFGSEFKVWAALLDPRILYFRRERIREALDAAGVGDQSSFADYQPHVSVAPYRRNQSFERPKTYRLAAPQIWWGDQKIELAPDDDDD